MTPAVVRKEQLMCRRFISGLTAAAALLAINLAPAAARAGYKPAWVRLAYR